MLRIYYSNDEYEPNKHKILTTYSDRSSGGMPEDSGALSNYSVIKIEERYNPKWADLLTGNARCSFLNLPDKFYVNNSAQIVNNETQQVVIIIENPQKQSYKLSQLYGLTQLELETYIDNQMNSITTLAEARTIIGGLIKKMAAIELYLVKQSNLG